MGSPATTPERYSPQDLPDAQFLYVLAGREHSYRQETNGSAGVPVGRIRFVVEVDSVELWGTTWREVAAEKGLGAEEPPACSAHEETPALE